MSPYRTSPAHGGWLRLIGWPNQLLLVIDDTIEDIMFAVRDIRVVNGGPEPHLLPAVRLCRVGVPDAAGAIRASLHLSRP